jgi:hypothetical protein
MKVRSTKERVEGTVLLDEYSNQHQWSKTSCTVQQGILQLGLLGNIFPEYNLMDECFSDNLDVFTQEILLRDNTVEASTKLKTLRSKFIHSSRTFELKKDLRLSYDLEVLISEITKIQRPSHVFCDGLLTETSTGIDAFYGVLKGRTASGNIHLRPLISEGDLRIGIYEILEPAVFKEAVIVQAYSDERLFVKEEGQHFRFIYNYQHPPSWNILM